MSHRTFKVGFPLLRTFKVVFPLLLVFAVSVFVGVTYFLWDSGERIMASAVAIAGAWFLVIVVLWGMDILREG